MRPKVSIITTTYNHEKYIGRCIRSAVNQTFPFWEQIVMDDGSSDNTPNVVQSFHDSRIVYIHRKHEGIYKLGEMYNSALKEAEGEFIAVLEGDDYCPRSRLEKQIQFFSNNKIVLTWGKCNRVNDKGEFLGVTPENYTWFKKRRSRGEVVRALLQGCFIPAITVMVRKSALEEIGGFQQPHYAYYVDYPTWLKLAVIGEFQYVDEILAYWGFHSDSHSNRLAEQCDWYRCSLEAFAGFPEQLKREIGLDYGELASLLRERRSVEFLHWGRSALERGEWNRAHNNLREALGSGSIETRSKALMGLFLLTAKSSGLSKLASKVTFFESVMLGRSARK